MYLHYVIDERVSEHPVQVDALILQNVLKKTKNTETDKKEQRDLLYLRSSHRGAVLPRQGQTVYFGNKYRTTFRPDSVLYCILVFILSLTNLAGC